MLVRTEVWRINGYLIIADSIEEAISVFKKLKDNERIDFVEAVKSATGGTTAYRCSIDYKHGKKSGDDLLEKSTY